MKHIVSKQNRALLFELVRTDFKLRYQGSILGYAWSLLRPLLLFTTLYVIFVKFAKFDFGVEHPQVYLLFGLVIWSFFTEMTNQSVTSIVGRGDLIRKIKIPRWLIIVSSSIAALISLGLNLIVVGVFIIINGVELSPSILWLIPLLAEAYLLASGISFFLSAAYVKYRDVSFIWEVLLQLAFYATPILYPVSKITNELALKILYINPMAQIIQDARAAIISNGVITVSSVFDGGWYRIIPYLIPFIVFTVGILYFRKESKYFAENI